jgi:hypothetical protein
MAAPDAGRESLSFAADCKAISDLNDAFPNKVGSQEDMPLQQCLSLPDATNSAGTLNR